MVVDGKFYNNVQKIVWVRANFADNRERNCSTRDSEAAKLRLLLSADKDLREL